MLRCNLARMTIGISFGQFRPRPGLQLSEQSLHGCARMTHTQTVVYMICAVCCEVLVQKVFSIGFSSKSSRWVGGALQKKTATNHLFCLHLVTHVLSDCCMSCFVLSSWSHIDVCGVVKLGTVVCACVARALEEKTAICIVL